MGPAIGKWDGQNENRLLITTTSVCIIHAHMYMYIHVLHILMPSTKTEPPNLRPCNSGCFTNQDTSQIRTFTDQDTSQIRTPHETIRTRPAQQRDPHQTPVSHLFTNMECLRVSLWSWREERVAADKRLRENLSCSHDNRSSLSRIFLWTSVSGE